ncbi:catalase [Longispora sp. NPDC051575]|uniref:catalase n=1 Tax=Longispora sp. NPDC051575 TaxID=3154943 RepID=UPI00342555DF
MTEHSTTETGSPAPSDAFSLTAGADGPILLHDHHFIAQMAHFNRERMPERNVHAKGGGAFGHFTVTADVSAFTKAAVFQPGTTTETLLRFSTVAGEQGSADTARDPRGFALKFYTTEGNYDLVGNNTPVFFIRDPIKFPHFIRSQKRLPDTGLRDNDMQWDFWTLNPESAHQVTTLFTDRGTPATWREQHGFGSHTYSWSNAGGERFWVKYHFVTEQGIRNLSASEAAAISAEDPDFHRRDLITHIKRGDHPSWTLKVQIMPYADAPGYRFNPFDLTKVWPHGDYPLIEVGRLTLDRNPENFFAQIEQAAFEPSALVPGIGVSPDKMLLGRMFAYADTHRHRIGTNYTQLPVNQPKVPVNTYTFDGAMRFDHSGNSPVYSPNSYGGPVADEARGAEIGWEVDGEMVRSAATLHAEDDDFGQPGTLVREVLNDDERAALASNVVGHLKGGVSAPILAKALAYWRAVDKGLGDTIANGVNGH